MLKKAGILLVLVMVGHFCYAYRDVPVLTHLNKGEQNDTFGFNLVEAIPLLIYELIEQDKVKLWDSPAKQLQISIQALKNIENTSKTKFIATNDFFMNEVWSSSKKRTRFNVLGFSFINKNEKGEQISYGFIDIADVANILNETIIPSNANGYYKLSYIEALYSRNYHFNVVQFGSQTFKTDVAQSLKVKTKAFNNKKKVENKVAIPSAKKIVYEIVKTTRSANLYSTLQNFLNENPEFFFNNGGNSLFNHFTPNLYLSISKIEVTEIWNKEAGITTQMPLAITIFFNNLSLPPILLSKFSKYNLMVDFQELKAALQIKNFDFLIKTINQQEIPPAQSGKYVRALENYFWTQITEYVKYD